MERRTFLAALGAMGALRGRGCSFERFSFAGAEARDAFLASLAPSTVALAAIAAAHLPEIAVIRGLADCPAVVELRTWSGPDPSAILERAGMRPLLWLPAGALIGFESLAARERAWSRWPRRHNAVRWTEIAIYRAMAPTPARRRGTAWPPGSLRTR